MSIAENSTEVRAQGWRTLASLHARIEQAIGGALQREHNLSVVEYTVLCVLERQHGWHMRMQQLAQAAALSPSATTRLINRLEDRGLLRRCLCPDDRRGLYSELTDDGRELLAKARPTHNAVLEEALDSAAEVPELSPLVDVLQRIPLKTNPQ